MTADRSEPFVRVTTLVFPPRALLRDLVDVGGREIVGEEIALRRLCERLVHAPCQDLRQRKPEAVAVLQRRCPAPEPSVVRLGNDQRVEVDENQTERGSVDDAHLPERLDEAHRLWADRTAGGRAADG